MARERVSRVSTLLSVVVVGAGVIGSRLLDYLARSDRVGRITIVDDDVYEDRNRGSQQIRAADVGKPKARAQARRLRELGGDLEVRAIVGDVRSVPLGRLRCDALFGAVDTRIARMFINQCAFRLGVPWFDAGVKSDDLLARVHVYPSDPSLACYECAWGPSDYGLLEQPYPCAGQPASVPTNAPAALGGLAASLQALEFEKWARGDGRVPNVEILVDAAGHRDRVTRYPLNRECRFDHEVWKITPIKCSPREISLGQAIELGRIPGAGAGDLSIRVDRKRFLTGVACVGCPHTGEMFGLETSRRRRCPRCGERMEAAGFGSTDWLSGKSAPREALARSLADLGFEYGDVFTVGSPAGQRHFEVPSAMVPAREVR